MESLSDWLYIILLVIAGVSGIVSSGKKKKRSAPMPSEPEEELFPEEEKPEGKSFWDIWEDIHQEKQPKPKQPKPVPPQVKRTPAYTPLARTETPEEEEEFFLSADSLHDADELKKAVIYAEVLHRKF